jgi:phage FluMu protein Com
LRGFASPFLVGASLKITVSMAVLREREKSAYLKDGCPRGQKLNNDPF